MPFMNSSQTMLGVIILVLFVFSYAMIFTTDLLSEHPIFVMYRREIR